MLVNDADFSDYDAGLLNNFGGGNVDWWQDYLRAEIGRANDFWRTQVTSLPPERPDGAGAASGVEAVARLIWNRWHGRHGGPFDDAEGTIARADVDECAKQILAALAPSPSAGEPVAWDIQGSERWSGEHVITRDPSIRDRWANSPERYGITIVPLYASPPATPVQPTASVEAVTKAADEMRQCMQSARFGHTSVPTSMLAAWRSLLSRLASLTPAPTQGDGGEAATESGLQRKLLRLAKTLHAKHYAHVPQWEPFEDAYGLIDQIDNMTACLSLAPAGGDEVARLTADLAAVRAELRRESSARDFAEALARPTPSPSPVSAPSPAFEEAMQDAALLGTGWVQFNPDGTAVRVDPSKIAIRVLSSASAPSPAGGVREAAQQSLRDVYVGKTLLDSVTYQRILSGLTAPETTCCKGLAPLSECQCQKDSTATPEPVSAPATDGERTMVYHSGTVFPAPGHGEVVPVAARSEPTAEMSWQDISTAPKDGSHILVAEQDGGVSEARWLPDDKEWWRANNDPSDHWGEAILATHWQPMPVFIATPEAPGAQEETL